MLAYDLKLLLHEDAGELPVIHMELNYVFPGFEKVERDYLERFYHLVNRIKEN